MSKIKQLSSQEAQKIAAGQVVDRPVNVVKELVENAVDAGATQVTVSIENGGKKLIRVVDNGCGMDEQDAQLCFGKHATSKITSFDQLCSITTFGFRGEALPSIAAISKVTLRTQEKNTLSGTQVTVTDGICRSVEQIACPAGTDISVESLFYNVPAREKFLKKAETETRQITQVMHAFAYALPEISFSLTVDGRPTLKCPKTKTIADRCRQLWDRQNQEHVISVAHQDDTHTITGAISDHQIYRYDRSQFFFFVNRRWVKNNGLANALLRGYHNVIPQGRFPLCALSITLDPTLVDSNVHPKKEEVIFVHPRKVELLIEQVVRTALEQQLSQKIEKSVSFAQPESRVFAQSLPTHPFDFDAYLSVPPKVVGTAQGPTRTATDAALLLQENESLPKQSSIASIQTTMVEPTYRLIGQFNNTYLLLERDDGLVIIDQHAAHERILYEEFKARFESLPTIQLLFPAIISVSKEDIALIEPSFPLLAKHGITIEIFGTHQLIVREAPVPIKHIDFTELVQQIIGWIQETATTDEQQLSKILHEKLHAQMACKAAVKAGDVLTTEKMNDIIRTLAKTPHRFSCPHGRPTSWELPLTDLERKFKRVL